MKRDYKLYLNDIKDCIKQIEEYLKNISEEEFKKNKMLQDAVIRRFEIIGEATKKIPVDFKLKWNSINWKNMTGMRDRLIHDYFGIDYDIVWDVVKNKIPPFSYEISKILQG